MTTTKSRGLALLLAMTVMLGLTTATMSTASAAPPTGSITKTVTGTVNGQRFTNGTLTVSNFSRSGGDLVANGTLTIPGQVTSEPVAAIPVDIAQSSCQILDLVLGPLDLNLLGLVVHLDTVHLNITAEQGPGNLLGNLLCAIAGLLDGPGNPLSAIVSLLNRILGILGNI